MESGSSSLGSQNPVTHLCPDPVELSPHSTHFFFEPHFTIILPPTPNSPSGLPMPATYPEYLIRLHLFSLMLGKAYKLWSSS